MGRLLLLGGFAACRPASVGGPEPREPSPPTSDTGSTPTEDTALPEEPPAPCVPALTLEPLFPLEGQEVRVTWACTTGVDEAGFAWAVAEAPPDALVSGRTVSFVPALDAAGELDVEVVVQPIGDGPRPVERARVGVLITDAGPGVEGNTLPDRLRYTREFGLPVLFCDPDVPVGQEYVPGTCTFEGEEYVIAMKVRGAASASYPKPSYLVDFQDRALDGDPLGMFDKRKLVLITTFDDNSYVRQKLVYDLWRDLATARGVPRATIDTSFVVVYLGGSYVGLYTAADHVDDEFFEERGFAREGNVYKAVSHDANFRRTLANGADKTDLGAGYEKKEGDAADWSDLDALVAFTADADPTTFAAEAETWFPVDEFMDWYLLVAYTSAADSAGKNAYLYNDPAAPGFRYVPWDFNHAWGQDWTTARVSVEQVPTYTWNNGIFERFHTDPALSATLWGAWDAAVAPGQPFDPVVVRSLLDAHVAATEPSARRDWAQWEAAYRSYGLWSGRSDFTSYDEEVAYLRGWVDARGPVFQATRATHY